MKGKLAVPVPVEQYGNCGWETPVGADSGSMKLGPIEWRGR